METKLKNLVNETNGKEKDSNKELLMFCSELIDLQREIKLIEEEAKKKIAPIKLRMNEIEEKIFTDKEITVSIPAEGKISYSKYEKKTIDNKAIYSAYEVDIVKYTKTSEVWRKVITPAKPSEIKLTIKENGNV